LIVNLHYITTNKKSPLMVKCFELILGRLERYLPDSYRLEQIYIKFRLAKIKFELKLINDIVMVE
jgi:hypothetical protein